LAEHARRYDELAGLGFGLAAISVDVVERSRALADQLQLPFPLLCDPGRDVVRAYGVFNEQEKAGIAYPSTFAIDRDRVVRFRSLDRTTSRVDLDGLFEFLRGGTAPSEPPARNDLARPARVRSRAEEHAALRREVAEAEMTGRARRTRASRHANFATRLRATTW
jgi:hypothetical protein